MSTDEMREGIGLTNLDQELFDGAGASKRDLVDYLDAVGERMVLQLRDRPLSVIPVLLGQAPFMQKNVPKYTPDWVTTVQLWRNLEASDLLCAVQRPQNAALVRQPTRRRVPPTLFRVDRGTPNAPGTRY